MTDINRRFKKFPQYEQVNRLCEELNNKDAMLSQKQKSSDKYVECRFEFIIENQRGIKLFGIPIYSDKSLLPVIDPAGYQLLNGNNLLLNDNNMRNYPLPDLGWEWIWDSWYVLMADDVDDQGWIYSGIGFHWGHWKGKYRLGDFVRRRIWVRLMGKKRPAADFTGT